MRTYEHLGTTTSSDGALNPDARARATKAVAAARPLRIIKQLRQVTTTHKVRYARAFAVSKLIHNTHTWDDPSNKPQTTITTAHLSILRCALGLPRTHDPSTHHSTDYILYHSSTTTITDQIRWAKLRYLGRLVHHAPPTLLDLLDALLEYDGTWSQLLLGDLQWMASHLDADHDRQDWGLQDWIDHVLIDHKAWNRECMKARQRFEVWDREQRAARLWLRQLNRDYPHLATSITTATLPSNEVHPGYVFYTCHYTAPTRKGMLLRLSTTHPLSDTPDFFVTGTTCRACLNNYDTRERLLQHLRGTARCWPTWKMFPPLQRLSHDEHTAVREADFIVRKQNREQGYHGRHATRGVLRLPGP